MSDPSDNIKAFRLYAPIYMQILFQIKHLQIRIGHAIIERYTLYLSQLQLIQSEPTRFYQNNAILGNNPETSLDHIPIQVKEIGPVLYTGTIRPPSAGEDVINFLFRNMSTHPVFAIELYPYRVLRQLDAHQKHTDNIYPRRLKKKYLKTKFQLFIRND